MIEKEGAYSIIVGMVILIGITIISCRPFVLLIFPAFFLALFRIELAEAGFKSEAKTALILAIVLFIVCCVVI